MEMRVSDIDLGALTQGRTFYPSPVAWEDEVLYFLMLDRYSDGRENDYRDNTGTLVTTGTTPLFQPGDRGNATTTTNDRQQWVEAGNRFVGGTLRGLESKIGYLQRLGITAIWVSPIFKQVPAQQSYHGYGIQNRSCWIPGSYASILPKGSQLVLRPLKNKGFSDERRAEIGVYNIDDSTTPESNKSQT